MTELFDIASHTYDTDFTDTNIGRIQRNMVWKYLDKRVKQNDSLDILELNCGTGEDAIHLAEAGHVIKATDISSEMLAKAEKKVISQGLGHKIELSKVDIRSIDSIKWDRQFDIVFSNFGGVNCIGHTDIKKFKTDVQRLLKPKGSLIMVVLPELCLWESFYFLSKLQFNQVLRRKRLSVMANVSGSKVKTWYYSPSTLCKLFKNEFSNVKIKPIGFFVPPSYLETFIKRNQRFFQLISYLETRFSRFAWQGSLADHYYIEMEGRDK